MIEVVRGQLHGAGAEEVRAFWAAHGAQSAAGAPRRLDEVVCVLREDGAVTAVTAVRADEVPLVGGRRFWIYDGTVSKRADEPEALRATYRALELEFDEAAPDSPLGVCVLIDADEARRHPEAEWPDPRTLYAGYLPDGRQVRIAYFSRASISAPLPWPASPWELETGYRIDVFAEQDAVSADDVVALWLREGVTSYEEARRRTSELLCVATDARGQVVGVSTAFVKRHDQLRADMWHLREFVARAHRKSAVGHWLGRRSFGHLDTRFVSGEDRRAIGMIMEIENASLRRAFPQAMWPWLDFIFIGETPRGDHVRVHYFPGAHAPGPE